MEKFKDYYDLAVKAKDHLPHQFLYISENSFEFDLIVELYKNILHKETEDLEVLAFISEAGELDRLIMEAGDKGLFSSKKLIVVKATPEFFKPLFTEEGKQKLDLFKRTLGASDPSNTIIIHIRGKDAPSPKFTTVFGSDAGMIQSRDFYPNQVREELDRLLHCEHVSLEDDAQDEFIYKTAPSVGAYIRSIRKLKTLLNKKKFTKEDVILVLSNSGKFNPGHAVDLIFQNNRVDFYRELSKMKQDHGNKDFLIFQKIFLNRANNIRKVKILIQLNDDAELFKTLGMGSYSDKRKYFEKKRLEKEERAISKEAMGYIFEMLTDLNCRVKTQPIPDKNNIYLHQRLDYLFSLLSGMPASRKP